jgi:uncharacterized protein (TIGR03437 family)
MFVQRLVRFCILGFFGVTMGAAICLAQPQLPLNAVSNAASYTSDVAQGSIFVIFGTGLGPAKVVQASSFPLSTNLSGTSIKVQIGSAAVDAIPIYTLSTQVAAMLPSSTPVGNGFVTVTYNGTTSNSAVIHTVTNSFGVFTAGANGSGPASLQNFNSASDVPLNTLLGSAVPGQTVILWGTGLGPVTGNEANGALPGNLTSDVQVFVGSKSAAVSYAGRSGCCAGVDQVNFTVPQGIEGCFVPVVVRNGGVISNFTTMSIVSGGEACSDPLSFSPPDLAQISQAGFVRRGQIALTRVVSGAATMDSFTATFAKNTLASVLTTVVAPSLGTCLVTRTQALGNVPGLTNPLEAGSALNIKGPIGSKAVVRTSTGSYSANPGAGFLDPGAFTVDNGSGGSDIGGFKATLTVPAMAQWTNQAAISSVARNQPITLQWTGGDASGGVVIIGAAQSPVDGSIRAFTCNERTNAGQFTVPDYVISAMPFNTGVTNMVLSLGSFGQNVRFAATGLDIGTFNYGASFGKLVTVQ